MERAKGRPAGLCKAEEVLSQREDQAGLPGAYLPGRSAAWSSRILNWQKSASTDEYLMKMIENAQLEVLE